MSDSAPPRRPLWQRLLFGASLGLNILVIGAVAGLVLSGGRDEGKRPPPLRNGGVAALIGTLPPEQRDAVLGELRLLGQGHGVSHRGLREDRRKVIAAVRAEPFDPDALIALIGSSQDRFLAYRQDSYRVLADTLAAMTPQERAAYADRLAKFQRWRDRPEKLKDRPQHRD